MKDKTMLSLPEWIQKAKISNSNKQDYLECAVTVGLELTNRLLLVVERAKHKNNNSSNNTCATLGLNSFTTSWNEPSNIDSDFVSNEWSSEEEKAAGGASGLSSSRPSFSLVLQIEDIVPENIMISLENSNNNAHASPCAGFVAAEVNVIPSPLPLVPPSISKSITDNNVEMTPPQQLLERDVCFALGKILFELFSQGNPFLMVETSMDDETSQNLFSELLVEDDANIDDVKSSDDFLPALKKMSSQSSIIKTMTGSAMIETKSMKANAFLHEWGLPPSICQLVTDLLDAEEGNLCQSDAAILLLEEAQTDLMQMRSHPERFLHDGTCPTMALNKTGLFHQQLADGVELYGREAEISALMEAALRVDLHVSSPSGVASQTNAKKGFLCEATFLSGHSGSGKSTIIKRFVSFCEESDWFVLACKFDRQIMPLSALVQSFDAYFRKFLPVQGTDGRYLPRNPSVQQRFNQIFRSMVTSFDGKIFCQLCELLPNLEKLFPLSMDYNKNTKQNNAVDNTTTDYEDCIRSSIAQADNTSASFSLGSGNHRLSHLFHVIFQAICSGGHPVVFVAEDLQWSDSFTMDILGDFVQTAALCGSNNLSEEQEEPKEGLFLVGSYRDNEVSADGFLMEKIKCMEQSKRNVNVKRLCVGELPYHEINRMLSFKFCLPMRHTVELARLVHHKTRGSPIHIVEFLRSIIQRNMMSYSVKSRRWVWDDTSIDIHMISEGVAELLARKLQQFPQNVIETLKVVSCFGQISESTIELLDLGQFVPDMQETLELAIKEGIIEKAGPIFAFSHDMLQESTYNLISAEERNRLHKKIGMSLVQDERVATNPELSTLAADQINMCQDPVNILNPMERAKFARINLAAGKHSIAASSYDQARGYLEAGISLLHAQAWARQYSLCLKLHEMSVVASFMNGNVETVSSRLDEILSNAKSFDDALNSRVLRSRFLASQAQYAESTNELLDILSNFGEEFPRDACLSHVTSVIKPTQLMLKDVTKEKILDLPTMKDVKKMNAMMIMGHLILQCFYSSPMLIPLVSCRMMELTFEFGFCEDTISGLVFVSHALLQYSDDILFAARIGRIAESLINGNICEHSLRAKLTQMSTAKVLVEPFQISVDQCLSGYNSAKIVGDVDNAMMCGLLYCVAYFFSIPNLKGLQQYMIKFFEQMAKHKRVNVLYSLMSYFDAVTALIGNKDSCSIDASIEMKTINELYQTAVQIHSTYLLHHVIITQMNVFCYLREYILIADLVETYQRMHASTKNAGTKRFLDFYFVFFEGISALCLARDTKQEKWRQIGEQSVRTMSQLVEYSTWNFENKLCLLQAELHYLNHRHKMAEAKYLAAITSAHNHRFFHEEAMAREMYGIYLVENKLAVRGIPQLEMALDNYKKWGAVRKVDSLKEFIELVHLSVESYCLGHPTHSRN